MSGRSSQSRAMIMSVLLLAVTIETQAQYFACWGWGPSCSRQALGFRSGPRRIVSNRPPVDERRIDDNGDEQQTLVASSSSSSTVSSSPSGGPSYRTDLFGRLGARGFPSIVTSGDWGPGFMGKRSERMADTRLSKLVREYAMKQRLRRPKDLVERLTYG